MHNINKGKSDITLVKRLYLFFSLEIMWIIFITNYNLDNFLDYLFHIQPFQSYALRYLKKNFI
jgi:hypothetical protein